ncbi:MAG: pyridoxamine 5'-phosphate oxidase family protein [Deltaproteobacteria bacterium]|jgi:nitroimidazol reductase NimA-like FMN-containing flavoprotein (pyridoxamine 5'-phosphate oxidase superfamily)|nr:pyridoxamine 5'-phosphate oxidase family protein [Deltaproteobacteria bacterium]
MEIRFLGAEEIDKILSAGEVGTMGTIGRDGPYVVALNYLYLNGKIYVHGRKTGRKMDNLAFDPRVSFLVYEAHGYLRGDSPCSISAVYQSVLVTGRAKEIEGEAASAVLSRMSEKFSPDLGDFSIPPDKLAITAVLEIEIDLVTGKSLSA